MIDCIMYDAKSSIETLSNRCPMTRIKNQSILFEKKKRVSTVHTHSNTEFCFVNEKNETSRVTNTCSHAFLAHARSRLCHSISNILALKLWKREEINDSDNIL